MRIIYIYLLMLRYRASILLLIFFLLSLAFNQKFFYFSFNHILAIIALFSSYVAATSINDIVDKNVDKINHPNTKDRPLISGIATEKDMYLIHFLGVIIALFCSLLISLKSFLIILISLFINYLYSVPPFKISYRTYLAPILLSIAYVLIPYILGLEISNSKIERDEIIFILSLLFLFTGRILLKDFRDRKGDLMYGKITFLLRYGKVTTCLLSFILILASNAFLFLALPNKNLISLILLELFFIAIFVMLYKLFKADNLTDELFSIALGAKMGNGLLLSILGSLILMEYGYSAQHQNLFILSMLIIFYIFLIYSIKEYKNISYSFKAQ